jgi:hypothetical protein
MHPIRQRVIRAAHRSQKRGQEIVQTPVRRIEGTILRGAKIQLWHVGSVLAID